MSRSLAVLVALWPLGWVVPGAAQPAEGVVLLRDPWGVPHVFAHSDAGAFYGLGYATAEDRAWQMTYTLRLVQGRLAEVRGPIQKLNRNESAVDHDRKMRTFGFYRAAQRLAQKLDPESLGLLRAYCDGVNAYFRQHRDQLHPLFAATGVTPEPWTPADCLACWWNLAQYFATDGTRDLIAGRERPGGRAGRGGTVPDVPADMTPLPPDDLPAVVKRSDVGPEWIQRVQQFAQEQGLTRQVEADGQPPRFSHAWVVGKERSTTGAAVLVSDPQTPVRNPSLLYHFHVQGKTFNARGVGVAGSPVLLIGFSDRVAWGMTALGADQADLFQIETDPARPDQYRFDGAWRPMTLHPEIIKVRGGEPIRYLVRETHLGPVATEFCFAQPGEPEVVLKRVPTCDTDRETIQAALAMMRAQDVHEFDKALAGWRFPSANVVFGDRQGNIGYRAVGAIPLRSRLDRSQGRQAQPGHTSAQDWQGFVPAELMPAVINPAAGYLYSGNHRPIESWYPIPLGAMTGGGGDTQRSWRLRERLQARDRFTPAEVLDIHFDAVNPARRDIVRLGLHLRDGLGRKLSDEAQSALARLEPWLRAGAVSSLEQSGAEVALELNTFFRIMSTPLAQVYGGGESGLSYFLRTATARIEADAKADFASAEQAFIDQALAGAWQSCVRKYGPEAESWPQKARTAVGRQRLGYFESLDGFPTFDPNQAVAMPPLVRIDPGTIGCQTAQTYTQWVPMHDPDLAQSLLPPGQSERTGHPARLSTLELWGESRLHPAPLTQEKVEALGVSRRLLGR